MAKNNNVEVWVMDEYGSRCLFSTNHDDAIRYCQVQNDNRARLGQALPYYYIVE